MSRQIKIVFEIKDTDVAEKELWESLESVLEYVLTRRGQQIAVLRFS